MLQGLRFADARKRVALCVSHEPNDPKRLSPILFSPPRQILERSRVEFHAPHKRSFETASSSITPPRRSNAACKRSRMVSDFNK